MSGILDPTQLWSEHTDVMKGKMWVKMHEKMQWNPTEFTTRMNQHISNVRRKKKGQVSVTFECYILTPVHFLTIVFHQAKKRRDKMEACAITVAPPAVRSRSRGERDGSTEYLQGDKVVLVDGNGDTLAYLTITDDQPAATRNLGHDMDDEVRERYVSADTRVVGWWKQVRLISIVTGQRDFELEDYWAFSVDGDTIPDLSLRNLDEYEDGFIVYFDALRLHKPKTKNKSKKKTPKKKKSK